MGFEDFDTFVQYTGMLIEGTNWDSVGINKRIRSPLNILKFHFTYYD